MKYENREQVNRLLTRISYLKSILKYLSEGNSIAIFRNSEDVEVINVGGQKDYEDIANVIKLKTEKELNSCLSELEKL